MCSKTAKYARIPLNNKTIVLSYNAKSVMFNKFGGKGGVYNDVFESKMKKTLKIMNVIASTTFLGSFAIAKWKPPIITSKLNTVDVRAMKGPGPFTASFNNSKKDIKAEETSPPSPIRIINTAISVFIGPNITTFRRSRIAE